MNEYNSDFKEIKNVDTSDSTCSPPSLKKRAIVSLCMH